jgi:deoxycytidylate deaminase
MVVSLAQMKKDVDMVVVPFNIEKIKQLADERKCAKQETIAVIINGDNIVVGSNWCINPQESCPRKDLPTGIGYDLCRNICKQHNHAESDACKKAGELANGADLYLIGHYYCCENCKAIMSLSGIKMVHIVKEEKIK